MQDWNRQIIEQFRANGGKIEGQTEGQGMLLLTTTGAKTGKQHTTPLACIADDDRFIVIASYAGAPHNPAWYHNLLAHPEVQVETGTETVKMTATVATGAERERLWAKMLQVYPGFAEYQRKTTRQIPVVILHR
ncbi:deazaflavin-dependent oxidoreductase (nitroreductase family) [Thermosporothrix hazakensis]|jgi:deazaflavin-dependent oxidoreductase (nitroreductase family)|uniref:Deazaflavin-dependent oxidoreductase (Nitroreductase family) n=2 Tax=Thermosporothrix TaxID=768650 RepID=A0A326UC60_THEHA|nr:nitroreductase family deazaflavin-dependent oxidoreductase [Thermosporothrix hazakensis]PZW34388.1 deazaflavin-dependent oxidoreductase (nitroreductase family) [Thermosporothrix hazakensis]BBH85511.1 hypothetical protein KTC_02620 [Thermosporothrix sp. COM3]GCE46062.1 hypothetical protein KTH_09310 [Thermosporothrix hazakensis]